VDFGGNCKKLDIGSSEEPDLNSSKDDLAQGLPTPEKTLEPHLVEPPSPPIKSLNTSAKKKPYYEIVLIKEAELKKKINSNIGE